MRLFNHLLLGLVATAFLAVPSAAQLVRAHPLRNVAGCYRLTLGAWSKDSRLGPSSSTTVVRLDTLARRPGNSGDLVAQRVEPAEFAVPGHVRVQWQRPAYWRREKGDSVVIITWSTGTEAEAFYGQWKSSKLSGVVRRTSDAIPVDTVTRKVQWDVWPWASASGVPVPCP
jgi:hypothetical protein